MVLFIFMIIKLIEFIVVYNLNDICIVINFLISINPKKKPWSFEPDFFLFLNIM